MKIKIALVILISKMLTFAATLLGGGTDKPGNIALRLYPKVLKGLNYKGKIIAVTGSNGKTTTSNLVAHMLRSQGYSVLNNEKGSNMKSGIATTLLSNASLCGKIKADYVVLEVDECYSRFIFEDVPVNFFLVLNLLRDQVVRNGHPDLVYEKIAEAIKKRPDCVLVLNANEPISQRFSELGNKTYYFAMDKNERSTQNCVSGTHDAKVCPKCFNKLNYNYFHYNHLGDFYCSKCDYKSNKADFFGSNIDFENQTMAINGFNFKVPYNTTFNIFNTVAATAVCSVSTEKGVEEIVPFAQSFKVAKDRLDQTLFEGRKTVLMMTKQNAASLDQSISYVLEQQGEKTVVIYINNVLYLEYKEISWLYDVAFERLKGKVNNIICAGNRALDAAVAVKAAGFSEPCLVYENDINKIKEAFRKTSGDVYILAASAFGNEGKIMEVLMK